MPGQQGMQHLPRALLQSTKAGHPGMYGRHTAPAQHLFSQILENITDLALTRFATQLEGAKTRNTAFGKHALVRPHQGPTGLAATGVDSQACTHFARQHSGAGSPWPDRTTHGQRLLWRWGKGYSLALPRAPKLRHAGYQSGHHTQADQNWTRPD